MQLGDRIGSYRLVRLLGRGGMGTVYEGVDEALDRRVAVKVLNHELCSLAEWRLRFLNEARTANSIGHPGIVAVHEAGELPDGGAYIVMELLHGETLKARLAREQVLPVASVIRLAKQTASALAAAHAAEIIHRDLKPENLFLVEDPEVPGGCRAKLLDFGIAKRRAEEGKGARQGTRPGIGMGTPGYLAPEQIYAADEVDDRADVYSLGVVLYEALSGARPFVRERTEDELRAQLLGAPLPLRDFAPDAPPHLIDLIESMLVHKPTDRPSMAAIGAELQTWLSEPVLQLIPPQELLPHRRSSRRRKRLRGRLLAACFLLGAIIVGLYGAGGRLGRSRSSAPPEMPRVAALTEAEAPPYRPPAATVPATDPAPAGVPGSVQPKSLPRAVPRPSPSVVRKQRSSEGALTHEDIRKL